MPAANNNSDSVEGTPAHWEYLYKAAERFGMPTILLLMVLFWIRTDFLKPLLDAHYEFLSQIRQSSQRHSDKLDDLIELLKKQNVLIQGRSEYGQPKAAVLPDDGDPSS